MKGWITIVASLLATILLWMGAKIVAPANSFSQGASQILGLMGLMSLAWTYILATRHSLIEQMFDGLDKAYKYHHILGGLSLVLLLNHVLLLIVGSMPANTLSLYLVPGTSLPYTLGILALYVMIFLLSLTLYVRLPYRFWKWSHEWIGIVIILGGLHGMLISSDTSSYLSLRYWVMAWSLLATASFLYKRFGYYLHGVKKYRIVKSGKEQGLLVLSLETSEKTIEFKPGQYGFFSLPKTTGLVPREEHAFSILGSYENKLIIGVKIVGKFSEKMSTLLVGDEIRVKGPFGNFGEKMSESKHLIWIAGGIGITPFLSMAKSVRTDQKVDMYFCARIMPPAVMTEPFHNLSQQNPNFRWLPCETSKGGRLTARRVFAETESDKDAHYMLCGPKEMMESIAQDLSALGIKRSHIIYEDFAFK